MKKKAAKKQTKAPKQTRSRMLVDTILVAATRVLLRTGYDKFTTSRIAEAAGVSIGSFYQYFPNKESLVAGMIDLQIQKNMKKIIGRMDAAEGRPLEEKIEVVVEAALGHFLSNRTVIKVLFEQAPRLDKVQNILMARRGVGQSLKAVLEKHRAEIRPKDLDLAAFVLLNSVMGVIQASLMDFPAPANEAALKNEVVAMVKGFLLPGAR